MLGRRPIDARAVLLEISRALGRAASLPLRYVCRVALLCSRTLTYIASRRLLRLMLAKLNFRRLDVGATRNVFRARREARDVSRRKLGDNRFAFTGTTRSLNT